MHATAEQHVFAPAGEFPNSALPVLHYRRALAADADLIEAHFAAEDWRNAWRDSVFAYPHFHSTAHEVMGVAAGWADLQLGGPSGRLLRLAPGDVLVIPAGVAHCNSAASDDFLVVGAYPGGAPWDIRRGDPAERGEVTRNLLALGLPRTDPVAGPAGPLMEIWPAVAGA